jgi:hypothetical protein
MKEDEICVNDYNITDRILNIDVMRNFYLRINNFIDTIMDDIKGLDCLFTLLKYLSSFDKD